MRLKKENERLDKIVKEKTLALQETITSLELSSMQKDVLMKEIHHRVKNNLQVISTLLNLQLSNIKDADAKRTIEEGVSRIGSIALIHHHLYKGENLTAIEIAGFADELFQQIFSVYKKDDQIIKLYNHIPATLLDIDTALPLGLILNELMTNSFKYAYNSVANGSIEIMLDCASGKYTLFYKDTGPGLSENYNYETAGSMGMRLIKNLSKQMGGGFSYRKADNCFVVSFLDANARKTIA
jgi:two-component sensor histidine kinase